MEFSLNQTAELHACHKPDLHYMLTSASYAICVLFHMFFISISTITVCGNLLVIISIMYFKQLHTPTNNLILSLAVADFLVGLIVSPLNIEFPLSSCVVNYDLLCHVRNIFDMLLGTSSILNLGCISIDRFYAVCQPLTYRSKITDHVVVVMILVSWGVSVLIAVVYNLLGLINQSCGMVCFVNVVLVKLFGLFLFLVIVVMICIYAKIFQVAQRQACSIQGMKCGVNVSKLERKSTRTLAFVMGVFLICWLPFFLCQMVLTFSVSSVSSVSLALIDFIDWLALSNSMLNPFIYAFFYSWFKLATRMILSGRIIQRNLTNTNIL